ncbi:MAG: hypothetical protein ABH858_02500, partial [Candidatus Omnitrophota bacterium]
QDIGQDAYMAKCLRRVGKLWFVAGEFEKSVLAAKEAATVYTVLTKDNERVRCLETLALSLYAFGKVSDALDVVSEIVRFIVGNNFNQTWMLTCLQQLFIDQTFRAILSQRIGVDGLGDEDLDINVVQLRVDMQRGMIVDVARAFINELYKGARAGSGIRASSAVGTAIPKDRLEYDARELVFASNRARANGCFFESTGHLKHAVLAHQALGMDKALALDYLHIGENYKALRMFEDAARYFIASAETNVAAIDRACHGGVKDWYRMMALEVYKQAWLMYKEMGSYYGQEQAEKQIIALSQEFLLLTGNVSELLIELVWFFHTAKRFKIAVQINLVISQLNENKGDFSRALKAMSFALMNYIDYLAYRKKIDRGDERRSIFYEIKSYNQRVNALAVKAGGSGHVDIICKKHVADIYAFLMFNKAAAYLREEIAGQIMSQKGSLTDVAFSCTRASQCWLSVGMYDKAFEAAARARYFNEKFLKQLLDEKAAGRCLCDIKYKLDKNSKALAVNNDLLGKALCGQSRTEQAWGFFEVVVKYIIASRNVDAWAAIFLATITEDAVNDVPDRFKWEEDAFVRFVRLRFRVDPERMKARIHGSLRKRVSDEFINISSRDYRSGLESFKNGSGSSSLRIKRFFHQIKQADRAVGLSLKFPVSNGASSSAGRGKIKRSVLDAMRMSYRLFQSNQFARSAAVSTKVLTSFDGPLDFKVKILYHLAVSYFARGEDGDYGRSERVFEELFTLIDELPPDNKPTAPELQDYKQRYAISRGFRLYREDGEGQEAIRVLTHTQMEFPDAPLIREFLTRIYFNLEDYDGALASCRRAEERAGSLSRDDRASLYDDIGQVLCKQGKVEDGKAYFEKAVSCVAGYPEATFNLAKTYWDQAQTLDSKDPRVPALYQEAISLWEGLSQYDRKRLDIYKYLVSACLKTGDVGRSVSVWSEQNRVSTANSDVDAAVVEGVRDTDDTRLFIDEVITLYLRNAAVKESVSKALQTVSIDEDRFIRVLVAVKVNVERKAVKGKLRRQDQKITELCDSLLRVVWDKKGSDDLSGLEKVERAVRSEIAEELRKGQLQKTAEESLRREIRKVVTDPLRQSLGVVVGDDIRVKDLIDQTVDTLEEEGVMPEADDFVPKALWAALFLHVSRVQAAVVEVLGRDAVRSCIQKQVTMNGWTANWESFSYSLITLAVIKKGLANQHAESLCLISDMDEVQSEDVVTAAADVVVASYEHCVERKELSQILLGEAVLLYLGITAPAVVTVLTPDVVRERVEQFVRENDWEERWHDFYAGFVKEAVAKRSMAYTLKKPLTQLGGLSPQKIDSIIEAAVSAVVEREENPLSNSDVSAVLLLNALFIHLESANPDVIEYLGQDVVLSRIEQHITDRQWIRKWRGFVRRLIGESESVRKRDNPDIGYMTETLTEVLSAVETLGQRAGTFVRAAAGELQDAAPDKTLAGKLFVGTLCKYVSDTCPLVSGWLGQEANDVITSVVDQKLSDGGLDLYAVDDEAWQDVLIDVLSVTAEGIIRSSVCYARIDHADLFDWLQDSISQDELETRLNEQAMRTGLVQPNIEIVEGKVYFVAFTPYTAIEEDEIGNEVRQEFGHVLILMVKGFSGKIKRYHKVIKRLLLEGGFYEQFAADRLIFSVNHYPVDDDDYDTADLDIDFERVSALTEEFQKIVAELHHEQESLTENRRQAEERVRAAAEEKGVLGAMSGWRVLRTAFYLPQAVSEFPLGRGSNKVEVSVDGVFTVFAGCNAERDGGCIQDTGWEKIKKTIVAQARNGASIFSARVQNYVIVNGQEVFNAICKVLLLGRCYAMGVKGYKHFVYEDDSAMTAYAVLVNPKGQVLMVDQMGHGAVSDYLLRSASIRIDVMRQLFRGEIPLTGAKDRSPQQDIEDIVAGRSGPRQVHLSLKHQNLLVVSNTRLAVAINGKGEFIFTHPHFTLQGTVDVTSYFLGQSSSAVKGHINPQRYIQEYWERKPSIVITLPSGGKVSSALRSYNGISFRKSNYSFEDNSDFVYFGRRALRLMAQQRPEETALLKERFIRAVSKDRLGRPILNDTVNKYEKIFEFMIANEPYSNTALAKRLAINRNSMISFTNKIVSVIKDDPLFAEYLKRLLEFRARVLDNGRRRLYRNMGDCLLLCWVIYKIGEEYTEWLTSWFSIYPALFGLELNYKDKFAAEQQGFFRKIAQGDWKAIKAWTTDLEKRKSFLKAVFRFSCASKIKERFEEIRKIDDSWVYHELYCFGVHLRLMVYKLEEKDYLRIRKDWPMLPAVNKRLHYEKDGRGLLARDMAVLDYMRKDLPDDELSLTGIFSADTVKSVNHGLRQHPFFVERLRRLREHKQNPAVFPYRHKRIAQRLLKTMAPAQKKEILQIYPEVRLKMILEYPGSIWTKKSSAITAQLAYIDDLYRRECIHSRSPTGLPVRDNSKKETLDILCLIAPIVEKFLLSLEVKDATVLTADEIGYLNMLWRYRHVINRDLLEKVKIMLYWQKEDKYGLVK